MVNSEHLDIHSMSIDELAGIINLYPWFGAARKELCLKMSKIGGSGWDMHEYAENALYIGSRRFVSEIVRSGESRDYSDKDLESLLKAYTSGKTEESEKDVEHKVRVVGGDFFSQDEYDSVKKTDDNIFSSFASKAKGEEVREKTEEEVLDYFCTETLAQIYVEQGYYEQAKFIYSKLILRYPEKSAYFADLMRKLTQYIDN